MRQMLKNRTMQVVSLLEVAIILFEALSKNDDPKTLKEHIIKKGVFQGLQGEITID